MASEQKSLISDKINEIPSNVAEILHDLSEAKNALASVYENISQQILDNPNLIHEDKIQTVKHHEHDLYKC